MKRLFDIVVSGAVVLIALPLWIALAIAIKLDSPGPIFYRGSRIGRKGRAFRMFKFRTMRLGADQAGPALTRRSDARVTRVGRFLRRFKLDEMPQLLNVLRGEMSIVGPRPEHPRYVAHYTEEMRRVFCARPGMASPAFIRYRHEEEVLEAAGEDFERVYIHVILPEKLAMDLEYIQRQSFLYDLSIFFEAAVSLFRRNHLPGARSSARRVARAEAAEDRAHRAVDSSRPPES